MSHKDGSDIHITLEDIVRLLKLHFVKNYLKICLVNIKTTFCQKLFQKLA